MNLKEYYEKIGVNPPKVLLTREELLYERLTEDNDVLVSTFAHNSEKLTLTQDKLNKLEKVKKNDEIKTDITYISVIVSVVLFITLIIGIGEFSANTDKLIKLEIENKILQNTDVGVERRKNAELVEETTRLKNKKCLWVFPIN